MRHIFVNKQTLTAFLYDIAGFFHVCGVSIPSAYIVPVVIICVD